MHLPEEHYSKETAERFPSHRLVAFPQAQVSSPMRKPRILTSMQVHVPRSAECYLPSPSIRRSMTPQKSCVPCGSCFDAQ
jgi:hypothetical protein